MVSLKDTGLSEDNKLTSSCGCSERGTSLVRAGSLSGSVVWLLTYMSWKPGTGVFCVFFNLSQSCEIIALLSLKDHQCYIVELVSIVILIKPHAYSCRMTTSHEWSLNGRIPEPVRY